MLCGTCLTNHEPQCVGLISITNYVHERICGSCLDDWRRVSAQRRPDNERPGALLALFRRWQFSRAHA